MSTPKWKLSTDAFTCALRTSAWRPDRRAPG